MSDNDNNDHESFGKELYSGTATFGRVTSIFGAIVATVIGIICIGLGIYLIRRKAMFNGQATATIISADCNTTGSITNCNINVAYTVNGEKYTHKFSTPVTYSPGGTITVYYVSSSPGTASITQAGSLGVIGWVLIAFGVVIPLGSWIWAILTMKYKSVAAVSGTLTGVDMIAHAL